MQPTKIKIRESCLNGAGLDEEFRLSRPTPRKNVFVCHSGPSEADLPLCGNPE
jgi:hypothetical protein